MFDKRGRIMERSVLKDLNLRVKMTITLETQKKAVFQNESDTSYETGM